MKELTLAELRQRAAEQRSKRRTKQKQRYHLARTLGFSVDESVILQNLSEQTIRRLAEDL